MPLRIAAVAFQDRLVGPRTVDFKLGGFEGPDGLVAHRRNLLSGRHAETVLVLSSFHDEGGFLSHHPVGKLAADVTVAGIWPDEDSQKAEIRVVFSRDCEFQEWVLVSI